MRKQTPEPVFGIIKSVLGFRQFSPRGLDKVRGEWSLVTMAWNLKRMFVLAPACRGRGAPQMRRHPANGGPPTLLRLKTGPIGESMKPERAIRT
jgi:hypothetical protein